MKISLNTSDNKSFKQLKINDTFYDRYVSIIQNEKTKDAFVSAYKELEGVSENRNLEIRGLGDIGGVIAQVDENGNIERYISKNFHNVISAMKDAVLKINKENNPNNHERRKPFLGNY